MTEILKTRRVHCPKRHVSAFVTEWSNGHLTVKCSLLKYCGDSCPYLKDPNYKSEFQRAPKYKEIRGRSNDNP